MRATFLTLFLLTTVPAQAQVPSALGQSPGTLTPAPPVIPPPPLAIPAPVPPASAGPRSVFQGTARPRPNYSNPPLSGSVRTIYRGKTLKRPPKKKKRGKTFRRPRVSDVQILHQA